MPDGGAIEVGDEGFDASLQVFFGSEACATLDLPFFAEIVLDIAQAGDQTHHAFRDMRIEVVGDHAPLGGWLARGEQGVQEVGVVLLGAGLADAGGLISGHLLGRHASRTMRQGSQIR